MRRKTVIGLQTGLLAGTALRLLPSERRAGRLLRAPEGHEGGAAPTPAASPAPSASEPSQASSNNAMDAFEAEFGAVDFSAKGEDDGNAAEADPAPAAEPGVSEPEAKVDNDDPAAALEAERHRANRLEEELREARKGKEPPKDDAKPEASQASDPAPKSEDYEFGDADSKYIADTARWNARQEFAEMRAKEALTAELNTIEDGYKTAVSSEEFKAEYPDFDEVVTKGAAEEKWVCSPLMALAIKASPVGGHVAYELAKNPAEAERIAKLIPVEQAFELGQKVGAHANRLASKTAAPAPAPAKVASSAPQPPANRSRGSGGQYASEQNAVHDRMLKEFR